MPDALDPTGAAAEPDARLLSAHALALAALAEVTPADTVGPAAGHAVEPDGVVSLRFENRLPGYPGWYWTVSVAVVDESDPTVLEVELLPGDAALLAPEWVPWSVRLEEYKAAQAAAASDDVDEDDHDEDDHDEDDDLADGAYDDEDDDEHEGDDEDDEPGARPLHAGDVDGVDIDELDDDTDDDDADHDDV